MTQSEHYLDIALKAAKNHGPLFKKHFGRVKNVETKNGDASDLVTAIDKQIENQIRALILKNFPEHKIIGEEFSKDAVGKNDMVWIIDPIDGTTNFIYGIPFCCISIALWDKKGPLVGVVYNPVFNQIYSAVRGQGTKLNGKKVTVSKADKLSTSLGSLGWAKQRKAIIQLFPKIINHCFKLRVFAACAWQICMVAGGNADFYVSLKDSIWDFGAASLIVTEAGGKFTDVAGKKLSLKTTSALATNDKIHKELLQITK